MSALPPIADIPPHPGDVRFVPEADTPTYEQIASHVGIAVGTVKSRIWRGRVALERLLGSKAGGAALGSCSTWTVQRAAGGSLSVGIPAMLR
jgi:hypothetical protein